MRRRKQSALRLAAFALGLSAAACLQPTGYECDGDDQCDLDGQAGRCRQGYCAYPTDDCPTGLRWEANAPTVGGRCVPPDPEGGSGSGSSSGG